MQFNYINILIFVAYDVQHTVLERLPTGGMCLTCLFIENSSAQGCLGEINNGVRIRALRNVDNATACTDKDVGLNGTIKVYDIEENGTTSKDPAVVRLIPELPRIPSSKCLYEQLSLYLITFFTAEEEVLVAGIVIGVIFSAIVVLIIGFVLTFAILKYHKPREYERLRTFVSKMLSRESREENDTSTDGESEQDSQLQIDSST